MSEGAEMSERALKLGLVLFAFGLPRARQLLRFGFLLRGYGLSIASSCCFAS
jgi:hypothetical protein